MEPVAVINERQAKDIIWDKCFICQTNTQERITNPTEVGFERFIKCFTQRRQFHDLAFISTIDRILSIDFENEQDRVIWHRSCYSVFTHANHIKRLKKNFEKINVSQCADESELTLPSSSRPSSRTSVPSVTWTKCLFCQDDREKKILRNVATFETSNKILNGAQKDAVLRYRLAGVNDLIAQEGKYHLSCYAAFNRKTQSKDFPQNPLDICFDKVIYEVQAGLSNGNIYTIGTIWEYYCNTSREFNVTLDVNDRQSRKAFRKRLKSKLRDRADFVPSMDPKESLLVFPLKWTGTAVQTLVEMADDECEMNNNNHNIQEVPSLTKEDKDIELLSWLYRVSVKIKADIKATPCQDDAGDITMDAAERTVPESLFLFLQLLCDRNDVCEESEGEERTKILSIAQDIVSLSSGGRKQTPKQLGIGLTIHQATRSKDLVQLLHAAGHSVSYDTIRRVDTALANAVLERYSQHNNTIIPLNFTNPALQGYIRYANDNIDIIEETLDGKGTFHASQTAAFRRSIPGEENPKANVESGTSRTVHVPEDFCEIQASHFNSRKPEPSFGNVVNTEWYTRIGNSVISEATMIDIAWLLARLSNTDDQHVPGWTAFNQRISSVNLTKTTVGPMPIINKPAHEFDTIWTVIQNCQKMTAALGQMYTVLTFDEQLYCKAKMLQWSKQNECRHLVVMLGGFHIQLNFTKVIGEFMADSGLEDILVESGVYGENTAHNILKGKHWNRTIRAHKLVFEALWRILWKKVQDWAKESDLEIDSSIAEQANDVCRSFQESDDEAVLQALHLLLPKANQVTSLLEDFDRAQEDNATHVYWRKYMQIVCILLRFTRAIRDSNWESYVESFAEMLPWFAAFDHVHYLRWGCIFLADMKQLEHNAPDVAAGFKSGDFTVKETGKRFNHVPDDQGLEHVNKMGKVAGGLVGITRTETARNRWGLTYIDRAKLVDDTREMLGISKDDNPAPHKETGKSRIQRDESDIQKLMSVFQSFDVFNRMSTELVCLTTGDIATNTIAKDIQTAEQVGKQIVQSFVTERLVEKKISLHKSIPRQNLKTFASLGKVAQEKTEQRTAVYKGDRDLFQKLIVVMDAGRGIDIDSLLLHELCHVPLALANPDGTLRATNKAQMLAELEQDDVTHAYIPESDTPTCMVIDGMALIQTLGKPKDAKTFKDYVEKYATTVFRNFQGPCTRVDVVFDRYEAHSIKDGTRQRRSGKCRGIRCDISNKDLKLPEQWQSFVSVNENKVALSKLLKEELLHHAHEMDKNVIVSGGNNGTAASSTGRDMEHLNSSQEEADTRMILHAIEAKSQGYEQIIVTSSDTDVLLLLLAHMQKLPKEVWMKVGVSKNQRNIAVHKIRLPDEIRDSLLPFHAITGCDTTSQFSGISKRTAWKIFCEVPHLLAQLGITHTPNAQHLAKAEEFVCKLYSPNGSKKEIHEIRCSYFRKGKGKPENMPPTQDALLQHILRAHYQALVWTNANIPKPGLPSPTSCGWKLENNRLQPILMTKESLKAECIEVLTCSCTSRGQLCTAGQCSCHKNSLRCTSLCKCTEWCRNPHNDG